MDDRLFRVIAKAHVLELHVSPAWRRVGEQRRLIAHLGLIENLEDAARAPAIVAWKVLIMPANC